MNKNNKLPVLYKQNNETKPIKDPKLMQDHNFDSGFSLLSTHHAQHCSSLKLTTLELSEQKVLRDLTP